MTDKLINEIVDYMIAEGTRETSNGSWCFYPEDFAQFCLTDDRIKAAADDIIRALCMRPEIAECYWDDWESGCFDLTFWLACCPNLEEDGPRRRKTTVNLSRRKTLGKLLSMPGLLKEAIVYESQLLITTREYSPWTPPE